MKYLLYFSFLTLIFVNCQKNNDKPEIAPEQRFSMDEIKSIAQTYGLEDLATEEKNSGLCYFNEEQLHNYFKRWKKRRDIQTIYSEFYANIQGKHSFEEIQALKESTGLAEIERQSFATTKEYDDYLKYMKSQEWHIYYVKDAGNEQLGNLIFLTKEQDNGTIQGQRLDRNK